MKRRSLRWFKASSKLNTFSNVSKIKTISKTGSSSAARVRPYEDKDGNKIFIAGQSIIGENDII